ncbi:hypothetical protein MUN78_10205 [Leucobacter allii]|uniref:Head-to-tail stopper n=1 Tax=Leucobacter allii TaxID=2932247 RepID=A0ABY4FHD1_9MICO|nr:hypothetical protein [Leucobacter allii]UOQ56076.1 hypothetical protein MUN78_10205 [Leucobacter allii]
MPRRVTEYVERLPFDGSVTDEMGDPVDSWGSPVSEGIFEFSPGGSVEPALPGHDRVVTTPTIYAPYDTGFAERDKCVIGGETYTVVGRPARWKHRRTGREVGAVVNLKAVDG